MTRRGRCNALLPLLLAVLFAAPAAASVLHQGDLVVTGGAAAGNFVAIVDPVTGARQMVSQGGLITAPFVVAVGPTGTIFVGNQTNIIKVNPETGVQTPFITLPAGTSFLSTSTMIYHTAGLLYFSGLGGVYRVDPVSGATSQVSNARPTSITEGPALQLFGSACLSADGISACGSTAATTDIVVFRIDRFSGATTNVGFGPIGKPRGICFDQRDSMYVESSNDRRLFRFNQVTGASGAIPLVGNELTYSIQNLVGHPDGKLYLTHNYTEGRVDRMDPVTNARSSFSTFPAGQSLVAITVSRFNSQSPALKKSWGAVKQIYR